MSTERKWETIKEYEDILFDYYNGIARITINRERYRNAFTPTTTGEMSDALRICREEACVSVVVITGAGDKAFCSGGDQNVKGRGGYIGKDGAVFVISCRKNTNPCNLAESIFIPWAASSIFRSPRPSPASSSAAVSCASRPRPRPIFASSTAVPSRSTPTTHGAT